MSTEAVQWNPQRGDMQHVPDQYSVPIESKHCSPPSKDRGVGPIAHLHPFVDPVVGDEGGLVRDHVVSGTRVRHRKHHGYTAASIVWDGVGRGTRQGFDQGRG